MKVAIVHYHLGHGGVPQTIRSHSATLASLHIPHVILTGSHLPHDDSLPVAIIPELDYTERSPNELSASDLADSMIREATQYLGSPPDIWHIHNHSLGKNPNLTESVAILARNGEKLLLHIHDLVEDGRPSLYAAIRHLDSLYPLSPHIHYAFLNERDRSAFLHAGLPPSQSHLLEGPPQAIPPISNSSSPNLQSPISNLLFAPIRAIRRKNLGELILLSVLLPPPTRIAISRAPTDPVSLSIHDTWQAFSAIHAPRILFAVNDRIPPHPDASPSFESWVHHASHIVGTSIAEGLGLPFLEARAWNKPFLGRRLPHLRHLAPPDSTYDRLLIPKDWIATNILREQLDTTLARDDRTRGCHPRRQHLEQILADLTKYDFLDFANLPEPLQQSVIERCADPQSRTEIQLEIDNTLHPALPWLLHQTVARASCPEPLPLTTSSPPPLLPIYQSLLSAPDSTPLTFLPPSSILHTYHTPQTFHFLTAPPPPSSPKHNLYQVILFDIYGTLLHTDHGPVQPDPTTDPIIARMIRQLGFSPPEAPTSALHQAVLDHHASSSADFPEVDLRTLWQNILQVPPDTDLTRLVIATEDIRSPSLPIRGAFEAVRHLAHSGIRLGLLSNAQCNALPSLDSIADLFDPDLILLSHQLGHAKPSPILFEEMTRRLHSLGTPPHKVLFVGNSPDHDITPAQQQGWHTALFTRYTSTTPSSSPPTHTFSHYPTLLQNILKPAQS